MNTYSTSRTLRRLGLSLALSLAAAAVQANTPTVTVHWNEVHQTIDGFGTFAGRATPWFESLDHRQEIADALFSSTGLQLSIVRAEVLPSYSPQEGAIDFHTSANTAAKPGDADYPTTADGIDQLAQLWILQQAKARGANRFIASTWTPPLYMKTIPGQAAGKDFNRLNPAYDQPFADYLAQFAKAFQTAGLPMYAISPMNEPEYPTPDWSGTVWRPSDAARFLPKLQSALRQAKLDSKIMIGENANWQVADAYLAASLSLAGCSSLLGAPCPADILASHGYSFASLRDQSVSYNTKPWPWLLTISNLPRWITEAASTEAFDPGMTTGLKLAVSLHRFLAKEDVSAYVFWLGVVGHSNESLIDLEDNGIQPSKAYDVYGQFSRYIHPGDQRIGTSSADPGDRLYVSAYRRPATSSAPGKVVIVLVNASNKAQTLTFKPDGWQSAHLQPYFTPAAMSQRWLADPPIAADGRGNFAVSAPAQSVTSLVAALAP